MAALSTSQAHLFGNVSKPSVDSSSKYESAPARGKLLYSWISAKPKRKRDADDLGDRSDLTSPLLTHKKVRHHGIVDGDVQKADLVQAKLSWPHPTRPTSLTKQNTVLQPSESVTPVSKAKSVRPKSKFSLVLHSPPEPVRTLIILHKFFLSALSLHYARNGPHTPAHLGELLYSITRLWKERSVKLEDIQRILAIYEMSANAVESEGRELRHSSSPFRLAMAGSCISVEYVGPRKEVCGPMSTLFDEKDLHVSYRDYIYTLHSAWTKDFHTHLSFFGDGSFDNFPKLACNIGTQSAARKAHASQKLAEILGLASDAQPRDTNKPTSTAVRNPVEVSNPTEGVRSRNESLIDRINAKQLANKTQGKPTPQQIIRLHALCRIDEVTEILRMMQQQQQQKGDSKSKTHDHTSADVTSGNRSGKVSFNLTQLRSNIKSSVRVPISDQEVTKCLELLGDELEGTWVKIVERKGALNAFFVVVEGEGLSGREVQRRLMAKQT
jgi:DNA replication factor Cdt1 C-terminal domain